MSQRKQKKFDKVLRDAKKALDDAGIKFHLHSGTALGAIRDEKFIDYDPDIDLGVFVEDWNKKLVTCMKKNNFELVESRGTLKFGKEYTFVHKNGISLDIFIVYKSRYQGKPIYWVASYLGLCDEMKYKLCRWAYRPYKPKKIMLYGTEYYTMPEKSLVDAYGTDWREPKKFDYIEGVSKSLYKGLIREY